MVELIKDRLSSTFQQQICLLSEVLPVVIGEIYVSLAANGLRNLSSQTDNHVAILTSPVDDEFRIVIVQVKLSEKIKKKNTLNTKIK